MKLSKIKEAFDKLKEYYYDFKITESGNDFECTLTVNDLEISKGIAKKKQSAKHECAEKGFDLLMENDQDFSSVNGKKLPYGDYFQILIKHTNNDGKLEIKQFDDKKYKKYTCCWGPYVGEGYGLTTWKARNTASYNLHKQLLSKNFAKTEYNPTLNVFNPVQPQSINLQSLQLQLTTSPAKINQQHTNAQNIYEMEKIKKVQQIPRYSFSLPPEQEPTPIIKQEHQQKQQNHDTTISKNLITAQLLSKELGINENIYQYYALFISYLSACDFRFHILGSYTTKSIRLTKPVLDIILELPQHSELILLEFLNKLQIQMNYEQEIRQNSINLYFTKTFNEYKQLKFKSLPRIQATLYLIPKNIEQVSLFHYKFMQQYLPKFQQLNFSTQSLMLVHEWRDSALQIVPNELLDFLIVQVTNEFQYLNSPYQVLCQIIYLLQHGILEEIKEFPNIELNPFLQSINGYYRETAQKLPTDHLIAIREVATQWSNIRLGQWLDQFQ